MGWKDAPLVEGTVGSWRDAPLVDEVAPSDQPSDYSQSHVGQGMYGVNTGLGNALGFPVDAVNSALSVVGMDSEKPFLGSAQINEFLANMGAIKPETDDPTKQFVRRVGESVGASIPFGAAGGARALMPTVASAASGGVGAATAQQLFPDNPLAEFAGEMVGSFAPMTVAALAKRAGAATKAPTVQQLEDDAGRLYEQAENSGVTFDQPTVKTKVDEITARAMSEGIDPTLHDGATAALKRLQDSSTRGLTVKEARTLRKVIGAAEKDFANGDQQRIAGIMRRQFDELLNTVPELAPANALYARAARGDMIDTAIELAGSKAGQFTGSGFENALRTEFRSLDRAIIKGQIKGLSEAEIAAIQKVARGGPVENSLRALGRLAPTGAVSLMTSGGLPFFIGNALGGPAAGATAAGVTMGAGMAGRAGATMLQKRNAAVASALARRGGAAVPQSFLSGINPRVAGALAAGAGSNL